MSAWHELVERDHDLQNPTSPEKIRLVGAYLRPGPQSSVLDVACGKAGPSLLLAQEFGCRIDGVEISSVFAKAARGRVTAAGLEHLITVEVAAALAPVVGRGRPIAVGEPFWRQPGRADEAFVDLPSTVARFEAAGVDLTGLVAASEDDWDRYESLHWRAAVETGGDDVLQTHLRWRDNYLATQRAELGWAIFTGLVR